MRKTFENLLIEQCSPTLAKAKTANLICYKIYDNEKIENIVSFWDAKLVEHGVRVKILKHNESVNSYLIYVFRQAALIEDINCVGVKAFLNKWDYNKCSTVDEYITQLSNRLEAYDIFPHEIGLFLGYPLEDVIGFVENRGRNYHCIGCWKVYSDPKVAQKCFEHYKKCADIYKRLYANGRSIFKLTVAA